METINCFEIKTFSKVLNLIKDQGETILLDTKIVVQKNTIAKEVVYENFTLAFVENNPNAEIVIVDATHTIPTYVVSKNDITVNFSPYESRLDTESDVQQRKDTWCTLVSKILQ
ncbi:MAG: hypothetical protein AAF611_09825 [Bacteroidota bacterium]